MQAVIICCWRCAYLQYVYVRDGWLKGAYIIIMRRPRLRMCLMVMILVVLAWAAWLVAGTRYVYAAFGIQPFVGRVLVKIPCTCTPGTFLVTVGPPRGGVFIQTPATRLYKYFKVSSPSWVLGMSPGFMTCMQGKPPACVPIGKGPIMLYLGTSMF